MTKAAEASLAKAAAASRLRVLYLHPAAGFGGASKSLIEFLGRLRGAGVQPVILAPRGVAADAFEEAGLEVVRVLGLSQFDNTRYGHYRGLRWLILVREIWLLLWSLWALWRVRGRGFDVVHANEITLLPLAVLAKKLIDAPLVVHVRSVQCPPRATLRSRWVNEMLRRHAAAVVAIDGTVARSLDQRLAIRTVHNSINVTSQAVGSPDPAASRDFRLGIFGVLIPAKGVRELIEAVRIVRDRGVEVECWIAGENARPIVGIKGVLLRFSGFARDVRSELEQMVQRYGLERQVKFLGLVKDIRAVYRQIDVLCFPSHLNAAGRPVFEAALFGVPSIVAVRDPLPDAIIHEKTGLAIASPQPELIAAAILRLEADRKFTKSLGEQAKSWASELFSLERSAAEMRRIYETVTATKKQARGRDPA